MHIPTTSSQAKLTDQSFKPVQTSEYFITVGNEAKMTIESQSTLKTMEDIKIKHDGN